MRGQPGQTDVAAALRGLVRGSAIRDSHLECSRVQDPYSLRRMPQVMGACLDQIRFAAGTLEREANAVTDNPLIFAAGILFVGGALYAFWQKDPRIGIMSIGLAVANISLGW